MRIGRDVVLEAGGAYDGRSLFVRLDVEYVLVQHFLKCLDLLEARVVLGKDAFVLQFIIVLIRSICTFHVADQLG